MKIYAIFGLLILAFLDAESIKPYQSDNSLHQEANGEEKHKSFKENLRRQVLTQNYYYDTYYYDDNVDDYVDDNGGNEVTTDLTGPVSSCSENGGACICGSDGNGQLITLNRFFGDSNDEKVWGCGGAFILSGAGWNAQWGGTLSESGPEATAENSAGIIFSQEDSYSGWEACCAICGVNLQKAGKISDGWYCEKDFFSTGIWLIGKNG
jgi:hypothetical protein